jgi:hypothetical protein
MLYGTKPKHKCAVAFCDIIIPRPMKVQEEIKILFGASIN